MLTRIYRTHAIEIAQDAATLGNEEARLSAAAAIVHAENALALFREADDLLPEISAARD